jgi:hypothetical protein
MRSDTAIPALRDIAHHHRSCAEDVAAQHVWDVAQMDLSSLRAVITQELAALDRPSAGQQTTNDPKT